MKYLEIILLSVITVACTQKIKKVTLNGNVYYTCSMHPQVMEPNPGNCPICGMELIPVQKSKGPKPGEILLSDQQIQLGNIHSDTIRNGAIGNKLVLTATLNFDAMKTTSVSTRITGRIEKLYYKNIGDYVSKGSLLIELYSEELNNAKQEYLLAVERQKVLDNSQIDFRQLIESAKNKLLLWGMTESQISGLTKKDQGGLTTSIYSSGAGYITELNAREGDYLMEGGSILKLADLSNLWAEAQVYTSELATINRYATATVQLPDQPEKQIKGKIEFVNPEINSSTRINLIRVNVPNPGNLLKPGMPAYVTIENPASSSLVLPIDAVIRNQDMVLVWVQTGINTFKSKMVVTGLESENQVQILSGLKEGDVVVTRGAYLLQSENIFRNGNSPGMSGHDMSTM